MGSTDTEINWTKEHRHQPASSEQNLAQRREHPYIWATWLPKLLTSENSCEWAVWFKAHYQDWTKVPSDFNQAQWLLNHTELLNKRIAEWELSHYSVAIEGQESASHVVQVVICLYATPRALRRYRTLKLNGQVTYQDHTTRISAEAVDNQVIQNLGTLIRRLAAQTPAKRVPSPQERRFYDITAADCPDRMDSIDQTDGGTTLDS